MQGSKQSQQNATYWVADDNEPPCHVGRTPQRRFSMRDICGSLERRGSSSTLNSTSNLRDRHHQQQQSGLLPSLSDTVGKHTISAASKTTSNRQSHFNNASAGPSSSRSSKKRKRVRQPCTTPGCTHLSVTRGKCRGHGGGRRCIIDGCDKAAQSSSDFCWGHGGGLRCLTPGCKRARKCPIHGAASGVLEDDGDANSTNKANRH